MKPLRSYEKRKVTKLLQGGILLDPLIKLVRSPNKKKVRKIGDDVWQHADSACLRSIAVGSQWPQHRKYKAGLVTDGACKRCLDAPGTLCHRHCHCTHTDAARTEHFGALPVLANATESSKWWTRCLLPDPAQWAPPPLLTTS